MALEIIDGLSVWSHLPKLLVGDAGYGEITAFGSGLTGRQIPYMVAVKATTSAFAENTTTGLIDYAGRDPRHRPT